MWQSFIIIFACLISSCIYSMKTEQLIPSKDPIPLSTPFNQLRPMTLPAGYQLVSIPGLPYPVMAPLLSQPSVNVFNVTGAQASAGIAQENEQMTQTTVEQKQETTVIQAQPQEGWSKFFSNHWLFTLSSTVIGSLGLLYYQIHKARALMNNDESWARWNNRYSLQELYALPQEKTFKELSFEIAKKQILHEGYCNQKYALACFFKETNHEMDIFNRFVQIGNILTKVYGNYLFFLTSKEISQAKKLIKRLMFLRTLVGSHLADQSVPLFTTAVAMAA